MPSQVAVYRNNQHIANVPVGNNGEIIFGQNSNVHWLTEMAINEQIKKGEQSGQGRNYSWELRS